MTNLPLPKMFRLHQEFSRQRVEDIPGRVREELALLGLGETIKPGHTVAITAGSRGIRNIDIITRVVVDAIKGLGARPFIFPAMGSHGGGTADGQRSVLANYGITEEAMGCEIKATMDVVQVGKTKLGTPVFVDRFAAEADHIAVVNRVKPHTKLIGRVESGLLKMCLIGIGKREGARTYHRAIDRYSWQEIVEAVSDTLLDNSSVAFGLALIQNAYEEIAAITAVRPGDFARVEPVLLEKARGLMGKLPFRDIDLLIVDEMGKDISGTGMDTNITGRKDGSPMKVVHVFVRGLTEMTHGNAQGIGLADFTTQRLVSGIDYNALYINSMTAYRTDSCKIPMTFDNDREVLSMALEMAGVDNPGDYKIVWIKNTLELEEICLSEAYQDRWKGERGMREIDGPMEMTFDIKGNLISPFDKSIIN